MISAPRSDSPTEEAPQAGELQLDRCGRQVLGFMVAALVPAFLFGLAMEVANSVSTGRLQPVGLIAFPIFTAIYGLIVTVPTILFAGLPVYGVYVRLGWTDLPRCLVGGSIIGWGAGFLLYGGSRSVGLSNIWDLDAWRSVMPVHSHIGFALLGAASVLMLWSVIYQRHPWFVFAGLIVVCPPITWLLV